MRRPLVAGVAAVALVAAGPAASGAAGPLPTRDSVQATGNAPSAGGGGFFNLDVAAQSGPQGETPSGHASFNLGSPSGPLAEGPVTCLEVNGDTAFVTITGTAFGDLGAKLVDGGAPESGLDRFDAFPAFGPDDCGYRPFNEQPVIGGDVVVVDAPVLPTRKEQCKRDGWREFGDLFSNQGRCVAFVQRTAQPSLG